MNKLKKVLLFVLLLVICHHYGWSRHQFSNQPRIVNTEAQVSIFRKCKIYVVHLLTLALTLHNFNKATEILAQMLNDSYAHGNN